MFKIVIVAVFSFSLLACASNTSKNTPSSNNFDPQEASKNRVSLGLRYLQSGEFSQAKFNLDKALEFTPRSGEANYAMAFYNQKVGELERAEEYYELALRYSKNDPDIVNSYGAFLCEQGKFDQAKKYFLQAVGDKSYVSTAVTYENLAICMQEQNRIDEAIKYFNSALNHQPTRASSLLYLTQLYIQTKNWEKAQRTLSTYQRSARVNADSLWLSYRIAEGQYKYTEAQEYANLLRKLYPTSAYIKQIEQQSANKPDLVVKQKSRPITSTAQQPEVNNAEESVIATETETQDTSEPQLSARDDADETESKAIEERVTEDQAIEDETEKAEPLDSSVVERPPLQNEPAASEREITETVAENQTVSSANDEQIIEETDSALDEDVAVIEQSEDQEQTSSGAEEQASDQETEALLAETLNVNGLPEKLNLKDVVEDENDGNVYHLVQPKENLYRISLKYNVKMNKLLEWNNLTDASSIQKGTRLLVRKARDNE